MVDKQSTDENWAWTKNRALVADINHLMMLSECMMIGNYQLSTNYNNQELPILMR